MGRGVYNQFITELRYIHFRLDDIEKAISNWKPEPVKVPASMLFSLPDHLRKAYMVVLEKGECSAVEVSIKTGRCRAIESNYLNQLVRSGWLLKRRQAKAILFRLSSSKSKPVEMVSVLE